MTADNYRPRQNSPAANNPAFMPPVTQGAPPVLPAGMSMSHGQSMRGQFPVRIIHEIYSCFYLSSYFLKFIPFKIRRLRNQIIVKENNTKKFLKCK